ncbi:MAG: signal peptidase I, partial [Anaerolineales bacterium]|nr:signal peptidase I [Anaerolineales bacterium]
GWRFGLRDRPRFRIGLTAMAALTGGFQVALFLLAGLVFGFGQTPYSRAPLALLGNMVYMLSMLLAVEIGRAYFVVLFSQGSPLVSIGSMTLLFAWIGIPYARYGAVSDIEPLFRFSGGTLLPALSQNLLACILALHGGPMASLAYRVVLEAFEWLSPILPNLSWTMQAFVGTIAPALGLLLVRGGLGAHTTRREARAAEGTTSFVLIASLAVALLWFNTGMFGIRPTLVSGVSMEPALRPGDIVIVRPVSAESLRVGDIVRFREGRTTILHRLVEIRGSGPDREFLTQGDANNVPDRPVTEGEIEGRVILILPKIGWLAIGVRQLIGWFR